MIDGLSLPDADVLGDRVQGNSFALRFGASPSPCGAWAERGPELQPGQRLVECSSRMFRTKIHLGHAHRGEIVTVIIEEGQSRILHDGTQLSAPPNDHQ